MPPRSKKPQKSVADYRHEEATRKNNPEAGLASYETSVKDTATYKYDPHLDPQLVWAGKEERDQAGLTVDTVSLHIHERVSTPQIIAQARREEPKQLDLFADTHLPLREAIDFYQHDVDWSNRIILGDSLLVMNSLLEREGMAGKVQMIYMDPPYGVSYNSNFQPAINRRDVRDGDDDSLTREPEMIQAYRDTWRLGVHSYLTYLRDRLKLARELLAESGSVFVQISDENIHHVRELMDETFGAANFCALIAFAKTSAFTATLLSSTYDFLLWYARDKSVVKYRTLWQPRRERTEGGTFTWIELPDGSSRRLSAEEVRGDVDLPAGQRFRADTIVSPGASSGTPRGVTLDGKEYLPSPNSHWKTTGDGMERLVRAQRVVSVGRVLAYKRYETDFPWMPFANVWDDTIIGTFSDKIYVVQTPNLAVQRCVLMTTDPGDLVFDPTCGSGTTAYVAEQWGRRWTTCDTSRVALSLARQRILTATLPYYRLAYPDAGVAGGFQYETVPHVTLKSIAQNSRIDEAKSREEIERIAHQDAEQETLYDKPKVDTGKVRVSGPFTVEAIPVPAMADQEDSSIATNADDGHEGRVDMSAADYVDTLIALLRKDGVTFPGGKRLSLASLRPVASAALHAEAEVVDEGRTLRVAVSFGPRYGPVTARQIEMAGRSARLYDLLIFAGFAFEDAAQAFIQENPDPNLRMELAHIRPDVQLDDLLKVTANSQLFSVFGQPDVKIKRGTGSTYQVELLGVDVYDPATGEVHSSDGRDVAAWFLDSDYDGRTFGICQAFFPGDKKAWSKLQKALKGQIPEERFDAMRGTTSLAFPAGEHRIIAVKVIDFRGNEVIRITHLDDLR